MKKHLALLAMWAVACQAPDGDEKDQIQDPTDQDPADGDDDGTGLDWPDNSWSKTDFLPEGLEGTGREKGDIAYDFKLKDQFGDKVQLYQFYGSVIVLDIFTEWCEPCQDAAPDNQKGYEKYKDDGLVVIGLMQEANNGAANLQSVENWADSYGLTHPVLADPNYTQDPYATLGYPTVVVIDREMKVVEPDLWPVSFQKIEKYL